METSLRLLVVASYYHPATVYGGPVQSIRRRNKVLADFGCQVVIYTTDANGVGDLEVPLGRPVEVDALPVTYFPRWWLGRVRKPFSLFFSPALGRALRQLHPGDFDLMSVHATFCDPGRQAAAAARRTGTPYICYTHGNFEPWAFHHKYWKKKAYWEVLERSILQGAAGIVVCNAAEAEQLRRLGIRTPIRRLPWGVELPRPEETPSRHRLEELFPPLASRPFVLFLSRLHPKKGLDLLIPAFGRLASAFPDWLLVLAGPNERGYREHLEKMVRELNLENRVIFTGLVTGEAKAALLTHAELFVLPSYSEGFPMAVAEALGYGRPLVITSTCYMPEVAEGGAGLEVPADKEHLHRALHDMMGDDSFRRRCSTQAREVARKHFSWEAVAEQSLEFYREAMECPFSV